MSTTLDDLVDVGRLIGFALQPTTRPSHAVEYRRVLNRYRTEPDYRAAADAVLAGTNARVLDDGDTGLVLGVEPESPFAFRLADLRLPNTQTREGKLLAGLLMVAAGAYAYPAPGDLDDDRVKRLPAADFEQWLRAACDRLASQDAAGELAGEETGFDEAWRMYREMPAHLVGERGAGANRLSPKCTAYWVRNVAGLLVEQGMAQPDRTNPDEDAWSLTSRFRVMIREMASEPAYRTLAEIARRDGAAA